MSKARIISATYHILVPLEEIERLREFLNEPSDGRSNAQVAQAAAKGLALEKVPMKLSKWSISFSDEQANGDVSVRITFYEP